MKQIRKPLYIALTLVLFCGALALTGCGVEKKAEDKASEALAEKALKESGIDVDLDGDTMTIKGEDGQNVTVSSKWPDSELGKSIPKFDKGRIDGVVETPSSLMITLYEVKQEDAAAYIEKNKPNFSLDNMEMNAEGMISWGGTNEEGLRLALTHQDDCLNISLIKDEK